MIAAEPISYFQAIVLGLLQGVSELFPISSLGHSVIFPSLFGWNIHQNDDYFITFLVATHLATAIVLFGFFWRDWMRILRGLGRSLRDRGIDPEDWDAKLGWLLVVGTIPAGILGLLLEHALRGLFASPQSASFFLMLNGVLLFGAEALRRRAPQADEDDDKRIARQVAFPQSFVGAAAVLKLPELFGSQGDGIRGQALVASLCSGLTAYFSVRFLMRYFETRTLIPFAVWCLAFGAACTVYFLAT